MFKYLYFSPSDWIKIIQLNTADDLCFNRWVKPPRFWWWNLLCNINQYYYWRIFFCTYSLHENNVKSSNLTYLTT
jgi:hypothetical protein